MRHQVSVLKHVLSATYAPESADPKAFVPKAIRGRYANCISFILSAFLSITSMALSIMEYGIHVQHHVPMPNNRYQNDF